MWRGSNQNLMSEATYTEWKEADGYRWREKLSGFECVNDALGVVGDFCDSCGDCVACYGFEGWDGHSCFVIEYE
jgi:hypothetical protein